MTTLYANKNEDVGNALRSTYSLATGAPELVLPAVKQMLNTYNDLSRGNGPQLTPPTANKNSDLAFRAA